MNKSTRRKRAFRTLILGILATIALLWGAVDLVGVPWGNLVALLINAFLGVAALILAAGLVVGAFKLIGKLIKKER